MGGLFSWFSSEPAVDFDGLKAIEVQDMIKKDNVVIFSKTYCPYCTMAKKVFDSSKIPYTTIELDNRDDGNIIQAILGNLTGATTVPRVFINGKCVGGGTDVKKLSDEGRLLPLLS